MPAEGPDAAVAIDLERPVFLPSPAPGNPIHVAAASVPTLRPGDRTKRFASGWGVTREEAIARCEAERRERVAGQLCPPNHLLQDGEAQATTHRRILPADLLLDGESWPEPTAWVEAHAPSGDTRALLPARLVVLGFDGDDGRLPAADTAGLACGSNREDAACRGFMELVERDAAALWWYNRVARPRLHPDRLGDDLVAGIARWMAGRRRVLILNDLTTDFGLPVVAAFSHDLDDAAPALGFGAGRSAAEAARHAVGELAQFEANLALIEVQVRERGEAWLTPAARALRDWAARERVEGMAFAAGGGYAPPPPSRTLDAMGCEALCKTLGLDLFLLDFTGTTGLQAVVRAIVPGLRSLRPRFAPGRLFDVPVKLGWLPAPLDLAHLNVPLPF
jgi:ribosomal protein S12 methylthiotransferase accessory factor